jgi:hypothetical protein
MLPAVSEVQNLMIPSKALDAADVDAEDDVEAGAGDDALEDNHTSENTFDADADEEDTWHDADAEDNNDMDNPLQADEGHVNDNKDDASQALARVKPLAMVVQ